VHNSNTIQTKRFSRPFITFTLIAFFLLLPTIINVVFGFFEGLYYLSVIRLLVSFLITLVFFYKNIKVYFHFLSFFIFLPPLFIVTFLWFNARPNFSLVSFLLQTNVTEVREVTRGILKTFLLITFTYLFIYLLTVWEFSITQISFMYAAAISLAAVIINITYLLVRK